MGIYAKHSKRLFVVTLILFAALAPARAGWLGQNPWGITWRVIITPHFKIIYPAEIEADAQRVANTLEHVYPHVTKTLQFQPKRLPVLLYNRSVESNGMALYMPRRSVWWNTPPQGSIMGTTDWYTDLAIHEFRHIVQFDALNRGFNRAIWVLFGETGTFVSGALSVPWWFIEGDAVCAETALTSSGRGRMPSFDVELRALLLSGKRYPYFKALFGSYRDWDPLQSPYLLGYYMTAYVRRRHGPSVWPEVLRRATWLPFVPHWWDFMMITQTGSSAYATYEETMNELEALWKAQIEGLAFTEARPLTKKSRHWTYHKAPQYLPDGGIAVLRYGMMDRYQIVKIDPATGKERRLCFTGKLTHEAPTAGGGIIAWSERLPHLRWGEESHSVIVTCDAATGRRRWLTRRGRLFAPSVSPDGKRIAAVEFTETNRCSVVLIDAATGAETGRIPNHDNDFIQTPRWSIDGRSLVYTKLRRNAGKALVIADPLTGMEIALTPFSSVNLHSPAADGTFAYFVAPYSGIDNIYAVNIATKKIYQVTSRKFGAYHPALSPDGTRLAFNDVTADGYEAVEMDLNPAAWTPLEKVEDRSLRYWEPLVAQEAGGDITGDIPQNEYPSKPYRQFLDAIRIHSWVPWIDPFSRELSLDLISDNLLGDTSMYAGYLYNWNERTHAGHIGISYAGWFPVIDFSCLYGGRASTFNDQFDKSHWYRWRELSPSLGLTVPFNLSRGMFDTSLKLGTRIGFTYIRGMNSALEAYGPHINRNGWFAPLTYVLQFTNGTQWFGEIYPRWGQVLTLSYTHTPFPDNYNGSIFSAQGTFYFPGICRRHSLFFQGGYERQAPHDYRFKSRMRFARGYDYEFSTILTKGGANYTFPIYDPDWNILHVIHIKRFYANLFGDYAVGMNPGREYYRSAGLELNMEAHLFTIEVPLIVGIRGYYRFDQDDVYRYPYGFDALFGIGMDIGYSKRGILD